jgi:Flp pilus assembly pilin Flp
MKITGQKRSRLAIAMTEYLIILGIVAIAAIAIVGLFGKQIKSVFTRSNAAMTGQAQAADTATVTASQKGTTTDDMGSFDKPAKSAGN